MSKNRNRNFRDTNKSKSRNSKSFSDKNRTPSSDTQQKKLSKRENSLWLYGKHAVLAALTNPDRKILRLIVTHKSQNQYKHDFLKIHQNHRSITPEIVDVNYLQNQFPDDAVHQGIGLLTEPLPSRHEEDICKVQENHKNLILVLDQVTDPHNVGAIIRSAAAFGAKALITTDRHAPPESGVLAKSASGALEALPWARVTNLSRTLDKLAEMGYWRIGLDGYAEMPIQDADFGSNIVLVLGAEGKGIRKGTADHCDALVKLPIARTVESLNVSNAAAVALYEFSH